MSPRSIVRFAPLLIILTALSGCINYEQKTTLRSDGSGTMTIHYWTEESVVSFMSGDKLDFDGNDIPQQYQADGVKVEEATSESIAKDSTRHMRVTLSFENIAALSNTKGFKGTTFSFIHEGDKAIFKQEMSANSSAGGLGLEKYEITYVYEMPGEVVSSNATKVDGNTLTWSYKLPDLSKDVMLTATVSLGGGLSGTMLALIIGGAVILISIIAFVFLRRRSTPTIQS